MPRAGPSTLRASLSGSVLGKLGGEYGGMGEPDAFAATLRKVLAD